MKKIILSFLFLSFLTLTVHSQKKTIQYGLEAQGIGTSDKAVPFWMRSNQYGSVPTHGASASFIGRAYKAYDTSQTKLFDWGAGFEGRVNAGRESKFLLIEGYAKIKASIFQFKAGRTKDVIGMNGDTSLSSGNFAISGNALGVPMVELSIPEYWTIPIFNGLFSIKGTFSNGWLGNVSISDTIGSDYRADVFLRSKVKTAQTYLHKKSFYARLGKPNWKFNLFGGFNHQVFWGNERKIYGDSFRLSWFETLLYVTSGKTYGTRAIPSSKIGNQLGSIDLGFQYDFDKIQIFLYRQNLYDVGAMSRLANLKDGLNGITIRNKNFYNSPSKLKLKTFLFEVLYTKNQAGEFGSKLTKSGDEDYYNNYFYKEGWTYQKVGLGTPFITAASDARSGLPHHPSDYFINNRVIAFHTAAEGNIGVLSVTSKLSFSRNFGTFGTSPEGHSTGKITPTYPTYGLFRREDQFSGYLEIKKQIKSDLEVGVAGAVDHGGLLYNSYGLLVKVSKAF